MPLLFAMAFADSGDTAEECPDLSVPIDATYEDGACVMDLAAYCISLPAGECASWSEVVADDSTNPSAELVDCGEGSDVAHEARYSNTESSETYSFDEDGVMVGIVRILAEGTPWCCDGQAVYRFEAGFVDGTCLPGPDEADTADTGGDDSAGTGGGDSPDPSGDKGCSSGCGEKGAAGSATGLAALLVAVGRRRGYLTT